VTESRSLLERTLLTRFHVPEAAVGDSAALIEWSSWPVCGAGSSIPLSINGLRRFGGGRAGRVSEGGWWMRSWPTGITP
jgi:hypothetical protein